jgi:predicted RNA binding protein YcfA (HicA-like mRNA interferase family)
LSRLSKLYMRVASAPANARFEDVVRLAEAVGFVRKRIKGSHHVFFLDGNPDKILTLVPERGQAKVYQVRQLLAMIEQLELWRW